MQDNDQARFLFVRKYTLVHPPADPRTLVGYMACFPRLLLEGLKLSLEQWSDGSVLRHMTEEYHLRLSGFIALAAVCLGKNDVLLPSASGWGKLKPKVLLVLVILAYCSFRLFSP